MTRSSLMWVVMATILPATTARAADADAVQRGKKRFWASATLRRP